MPPASLTVDWNRQVGQAWTEILRDQRLERATVMEIGPGFSDKVAFGLAGLAFRGTILLVEPNTAARRWALGRYRQLLPRARVAAVAGRMQDVGAGHRVDALVANHVLDDLILDDAVPFAVSSRLFSTMRPDAACSPKFIETWSALLAGARPRVGRVAEAFATCIASVRPGVFAVNHYPSWRHSMPSLEPINRLSLQLIDELQIRLRARRFPCVTRSPASMQWLTGGMTDVPR